MGRVEQAYKLISATGTQFVFLLNVMSQSRPAGSGWQEFPSNHQVVDSSNIISDCQHTTLRGGCIDIVIPPKHAFIEQHELEGRALQAA